MNKLKRFTPPGTGAPNIKNWFLSGILLSALLSLSFLMKYANNLAIINKEIRLRGYSLTMMPPYDKMVHGLLFGFVITAAVMFVFVFFHYQYFHQGSKSYYVMRRLKSGKEMHFRCWALPIVFAILALSSGALLYYFYCWIYFTFTPEANIPPQDIQFIWRYLS